MAPWAPLQACSANSTKSTPVNSAHISAIFTSTLSSILVTAPRPVYNDAAAQQYGFSDSLTCPLLPGGEHGEDVAKVAISIPTRYLHIHAVDMQKLATYDESTVLMGATKGLVLCLALRFYAQVPCPQPRANLSICLSSNI